MVKTCLADELVIEKQKTAVFDNDDFTMETAKKRAMERALEEAGGNVQEAIALLKISNKTYYNLKNND